MSAALEYPAEMDHPVWCAPEYCDGEFWPVVTHHEWPRRWHDDELKVTVAMVRIDEMHHGQQVLGESYVRVAVATGERGPQYVDGIPQYVDVDMLVDPAEARVLASLLVGTAKRVELAQQERAHRRVGALVCAAERAEAPLGGAA